MIVIQWELNSVSDSNSPIKFITQKFEEVECLPQTTKLYSLGFRDREYKISYFGNLSHLLIIKSSEN